MTSEKSRIAVVGAGFMGVVIASIFARHGFDVALTDSNSDMLSSALARASKILAALPVDDRSKAAILTRIGTHRYLRSATKGAFLVQETIQEDLKAKQELFARLDETCPEEVVLATNTSSFMLSDICKGVRAKHRVLGIHFVSPAHVVKTVEIITMETTDQTLVTWARDFVSLIDHVGVVCRERPGFLINRIQFAMLSEIYKLIDEGYATPRDIDAAVRSSLGPRLALWGPLMCEDLVVSKATALAVVDYLRLQTGQESYEAPATLRSMVKEGKIGAIAGQGWYHWEESYDQIVEKRDMQLTEIMGWLDKLEPLRAAAPEAAEASVNR